MFFDPIAQVYCSCSGTSKHGASRAALLSFTKTPVRFCLVGLCYNVVHCLTRPLTSFIRLQPVLARYWFLIQWLAGCGSGYWNPAYLVWDWMRTGKISYLLAINFANTCQDFVGLVSLWKKVISNLYLGMKNLHCMSASRLFLNPKSFFVTSN
jgi:hypothetical protein